MQETNAPQPVAVSELPSCSIIIPTHNRPAPLVNCLESLTRLDYPRDRFEVIVVVDGNGAPPPAQTARYNESLHLTVLSQPHSGPGAARNAGAARAKGTLLVFVDDDCEPTPDWLRRLATCYLAAPGHAIGGRTTQAASNSLCSTASHLLIEYLYEYFNLQPGSPRFFASNNLAVPAKLFGEIGGFDARFSFATAEDRAFCRRWLLRGHGMTCATDALLHHHYPANLGRFLRMHYRYGRGSYLFRRLAPSVAGARRLEPPGFYTRLVLYPFRKLRGWRAPAVATLLALSQAATALGYARQVLVRSPRRPAQPNAATFLDRLKLLAGLITGGRAKGGPFFAAVDVTRRCNLTCAACPWHSPLLPAGPQPASGGDLDPDMFRSLLADLSRMGTRGIVLGGDGEPLLHPRLPEFASQVKEAGLYAWLLTNGTLLLEPLINRLVDSRLDVIRVSLWAATPEDFASSYPGCKGEYFERMIEGIRSMARAKAARRSPYPLLQIHHPIGSASYRNLSRFVDLAIRTGCNAVSFSPMKNAQGALSSCGLTPEMEAEAIASLQREKPRLEEAGIRHNVRETILRYRLGEAVWKNAPCYTPWLQTRIKADGIVQPCNPCRLPMGNLREQSFPTIWNGARYQAFRRGWLAAPPGSPPPEACDCGFCCFLPDHLRVHRVYKWFLPLFRPREADGSSSC